MIHPSYVDLMEVVNKDVEEGETPVINSRYSIVMATAKRARQIVDGDEPLVKVSRGEKPLSIAVDELNQAEIRILAEDEAEEEYMIESETAAEELSEADEVQTEDTDASDAAQDSDAEDTENTLDEITAEETAGTAAEEIAADEEEIAAAEEAEDVAE